MMAALSNTEQRQPGAPGEAARTVLPVVLMDFKMVTAIYKQHWTARRIQEASEEGFEPAGLADLQRLLEYSGVRQDQVHVARPVHPVHVLSG